MQPTSQPQPSLRLVVACVLGLVLLTSLSTIAVGHASAAPVEPTGSPVDSIEDRHPLVPTAVGTATDTEPARSVDPATTVSGSTTVAPLIQGIDITSLQDVDDGLSRLELQTHGGVGDSPLGPSGLVALAGYSRSDDSDPLDNDVRARLYDTVRESPGIYPAALVDRLDVPRSTVRYHLRILSEEGLVSERSVDGRRRYVTADATAAERTLAIIDDGTTAATIVDHLARDGSATVSDLADRLDCSPGTVSYHLDRLDESGVVDRERDGRAVRNQLTPTVRPLVTSTSTSTSTSTTTSPPASDPFSVATDD